MTTMIGHFPQVRKNYHNLDAIEQPLQSWHPLTIAHLMDTTNDLEHTCFNITMESQTQWTSTWSSPIQ